MFRMLFLLVILVGVAAYFTKPDRAAHETAARAALEETAHNAAAGFDLSELVNAGAAAISGGRYEDYYLFSKYTVKVGETPFLTCIGALTQVGCSTEAAVAENAASALLPKGN